MSGECDNCNEHTLDCVCRLGKEDILNDTETLDLVLNKITQTLDAWHFSDAEKIALFHVAICNLYMKAGVSDADIDEACHALSTNAKILLRIKSALDEFS